MLLMDTANYFSTTSGFQLIIWFLDQVVVLRLFKAVLDLVAFTMLCAPLELLVSFPPLIVLY